MARFRTKNADAWPREADRWLSTSRGHERGVATPLSPIYRFLVAEICGLAFLLLVEPWLEEAIAWQCCVVLPRLLRIAAALGRRRVVAQRLLAAWAMTACVVVWLRLASRDQRLGHAGLN